MRGIRIGLVVAALAVLALPAVASGGDNFQQRIALPNGFQPEGIASTGGTDLFVGSIPTGAIWRGDARTGSGSILVPPHEGRSAIGIKVARGLIFVSGGETGDAYVYDARTGADVAAYQLAPEGANTFVNDVVVTGTAAYFTDSRLQQLYVLPLEGGLPAQDEVRTLPLTGDIAYTTGNNANGIVASGRWLIVVQGNVGKLFRVDPATGVAREIDLGGADVRNGDGLLIRGRTLYVVQNRLNRIAVIRLSGDLLSGRVTDVLTDPDFAVPTTITVAAGRLFAVNARFGTPPGPDVPYWIARVG
ncbi:MAG: superoxide dismutase [Actinomycetota bacterium]|nr:superoxide dismutase [Actinomycetota bacterium]